MKFEHPLTQYTKINSKWIKDLNYNTLRGKHRQNILWHKIFFNPLPRIMEKKKINKWDLIKLKSFCTTKETINKLKRQPSEWEKILANEATDKGLVSKIFKQSMQLNIKKANNPIKKWSGDLNRQFSIEDTQMANKHMKNVQSSTSLTLEKCKSKL